jgi:hypothetical protein
MYCIFIKVILILYITITLEIYNIFHYNIFYIYRSYFNITYNCTLKIYKENI